MSGSEATAAARAGALVVRALLETRGVDAGPALEAGIDAGVADAQRAWPWYEPGAGLWSVVAAYLAADDRERDLAQLRWADAALVDAFRRGCAPAAGVLADSVMPAVQRRVAASFGISEEAGVVEDLSQGILCRLLDRDRPIGYAGRGSLAGWLGRWLFRDLFKATRGPIRAAVDLEDLLARDLAAAHSNLVVQPVASTRWCVPYLRDALHRACRALPLEDRRILRYIHVADLTAAQAGAALGLHRVTVQRRVAHLRRSLRDEVGRALRQAHGFGTAELAILGRTLADELDPHLSRALASTSRSAPSG